MHSAAVSVAANPWAFGLFPSGSHHSHSYKSHRSHNSHRTHRHSDIARTTYSRHSTPHNPSHKAATDAAAANMQSMNVLPFGVPPFGNEHNGPHNGANRSSHQGAHQALNREGNHGSRGSESRDESNGANPTEPPEPWPLPPSSLHRSYRPDGSTHMHRIEKPEIPDAPDPESERELERIIKLIYSARIEDGRKKKSKKAKERDEEGGWCVVM